MGLLNLKWVFLKVDDDGDDDKMIAENIDDEPACRVTFRFWLLM